MAFCAETLPLIEMVHVDATFTRMCPPDNMKTRPLTFPIHIAINNNYQYYSMEWICIYIFLFVPLCSGSISHLTRIDYVGHFPPSVHRGGADLRVYPESLSIHATRPEGFPPALDRSVSLSLLGMWPAVLSVSTTLTCGSLHQLCNDSVEV